MTVLGAVSALVASCSSSSPIDINFGKEAGTGFDAPLPETGGGADAGASGGSGASDGDSGLGGATGSDGSGDADTDTGATGDTAWNLDRVLDRGIRSGFADPRVTDSARPTGPQPRKFHWNRPEIGDNQLHYPHDLPNAGRA